MIEIKLSPVFRKDLKRLSKKYRSLLNEVGQLIDELETNPYLGTDLGDNVRKIRLGITSKGKGKRGGARVLTDTEAVVSMDEGHLTLFFMTSRNAKRLPMRKSKNCYVCPAITNNSLFIRFQLYRTAFSLPKNHGDTRSLSIAHARPMLPATPKATDTTRNSIPVGSNMK